MDQPIRDLVHSLHAGPYRYAAVLTGGGVGAAAWLLAVPGGSRTILELAVPYHEAALGEYLGYSPPSSCSIETARALAARALERARILTPREAVAGVACTASLRSDRPKRGEHRFHIAIATDQRIHLCSLILAKEQRKRAAEEDLLDRVLLNTLAERFGLPQRVEIALLPNEQLTHDIQEKDDPLSAFLAGQRDRVCVLADGRATTETPSPRLLLPGSFNPLHEGHCRLLQHAEKQTGLSGAFELTVRNADKPALANEDVRWRLAQFAWRSPLWLTRAPTFAEKARLFPDTTFVVGADTAARLVEPRFYADSVEKMNEALAEIGQRGCRFLVAGRVDGSGQFRAVDQLDFPDTHRPLFQGLTFRHDLSSTQLRGGR